MSSYNNDLSLSRKNDTNNTSETIIVNDIEHHNPSSIAKKFPKILSISSPQDFKNFSLPQLTSLCSDLREYLIEIISQTGGHLGAALGVTEITTALHYVFNTPHDKIIWDIGHQSHIHKILTGRATQLATMKTENGLSGFCSIAESPYDTIGAGHCSTSLSSALGIACAQNIGTQNLDKNQLTTPSLPEIITLIGDASLASGMAFEALNNIAIYGKRMIILINDNDMSICPSLGGLTNHLRQLRQDGAISPADFKKRMISTVANKTSYPISSPSTAHLNNIFSALGIEYIGPINGNNLEEIVEILSFLRDYSFNFPIIVHAITEKGKGWHGATSKHDRGHAVNKADIATTSTTDQCLTPIPSSSIKNKTYTEVFAETIHKLIREDKKAVAISPAMLSGSGLLKVKEEFPDNVFDVAISEQHAVTFAGGMSLEKGIKPFCCLYSTFLQRAYDQVIHDICIQSLPVRFVIDRAGYVGPDDPTHSGSFDTAFLRIVPNIILMAPTNLHETQEMLLLMHGINTLPSAIRFPRGTAGVANDLYSNALQNYPLALGKAMILTEGKEYTKDNSINKIAIIGYGAVFDYIQQAYDCLQANNNISVTIVNARFAKPIDNEFYKTLSSTHNIIITIEDGSVGGFGSIISAFLHHNNYTGKFKSLHHPDQFLLHNTIAKQHSIAKIDSTAIIDAVLKLISN